MSDLHTWVEPSPDHEQTLVDTRGFSQDGEQTRPVHEDVPVPRRRVGRRALHLGIESIRRAALPIVVGQSLALCAAAGVAMTEHRKASQTRRELCILQGECGSARMSTSPKPPAPMPAGDVYVGVPVSFEYRDSERLATDLIISNHFDDARVEIELLSQEFPADLVYRDLGRALRWKTRCLSLRAEKHGGC